MWRSAMALRRPPRSVPRIAAAQNPGLSDYGPGRIVCTRVSWLADCTAAPRYLAARLGAAGDDG